MTEDLTPEGVEEVCEGVYLVETSDIKVLESGLYLTRNDFIAASRDEGSNVFDSLVHALINASDGIDPDEYESSPKIGWAYEQTIGGHMQLLLDSQLIHDLLPHLQARTRKVVGVGPARLKVIEKVVFDILQDDSPTLEVNEVQHLLEVGVMTKSALTKFIADEYDVGKRTAPMLAALIVNGLADPTGELRQERRYRFIESDEEESDLYRRFEVDAIPLDQVFDFVDSVNAARIEDPIYKIPGMGPAPFAKLYAFVKFIRNRSVQDGD